MVTDQTRRTLLKAALFGVTAPILPFGCSAVSSVRKGSPALIGCALSGRGHFDVVVADQQGLPIRTLPLPSRGHGVAVNSVLNHGVAFARRPGDYFMVFDYQSGEMIQLRSADRQRHYYGHGVYSPDGQWLYTTEGERDSSRGIIGVYDVAAGYQKCDEFSGFGIGPHEVIMMPDGKLAIGVGGVHTQGRVPINLDRMQPSLSYLSPQGQLIDQVALPNKRLSIRHLAHDGDNTVLCGQQYRGQAEDTPALLAMHSPGRDLISLKAEPEQWARFDHYIASIAASEDWILATSPRGNCFGIWSKQSLELVELSPLPDASGVVVFDDAFCVSSGAGTVVTQTHPHDQNSIHSTIQWDNHWSAIM
ncbi:hypothetical protein VII00023_07164 [Vibrio ichthyoenteri ATCC 700023]|uniref:DUF1513 domain-containing protein n=1 Tax=Vibrio ichthyoenteri ATCC 700023 TaxID=870968 RepID=F9S3X0_9VIBR|nr:DUF1513 domain-containing protein [Vibrio ichthyoenteri]EGU37703.1 hypothetical protein VII00023_07164 [Vibrio ichthyoenteri ATCC 700023]